MTYTTVRAIEQYKSGLRLAMFLSVVFALLSLWSLLASVGAWWNDVSPGLRADGTAAQIVYSVVFGLIFLVMVFMTMLMLIGVYNEWDKLRYWRNMP